MSSGRIPIWLLWLTLSGPLQAAHVTDKLAVGLYQRPTDEDRPLRILTSGTPLDVLGQEGRFAEVRLADGTRGWLDRQYITDEKPARAMLLEAQARAAEATKQLADLRTQLERRQREILELRRQPNATGDGPRGATPQKGGGPPPHTAGEPVPVPAPPPPPPAGWPWVLAAASGLIGFLLGLLTLDLGQRWRQGDFRIRR